MIPVHMSNQKMFDLQILDLGQLKNIIRKPARIENRRLTALGIPHHKAIHLKPFSCCDHAQFRPSR